MYKNSEGYADPTAGKAIREANRTPYHVREAFKAIREISSLLGFEVTEIRDKKTGRVYSVGNDKRAPRRVQEQ